MFSTRVHEYPRLSEYFTHGSVVIGKTCLPFFGTKLAIILNILDVLDSFFFEQRCT
jgi:hypothetical protein